MKGLSSQDAVPPEDPADFQVHFISGKELAKEVDNEHKSFQVHRVKLTNMERSKVCDQLFVCVPQIIGCQSLSVINYCVPGNCELSRSILLIRPGDPTWRKF